MSLDPTLDIHIGPVFCAVPQFGRRLARHAGIERAVTTQPTAKSRLRAAGWGGGGGGGKFVFPNLCKWQYQWFRPQPCLVSDLPELDRVHVTPEPKYCAKYWVTTALDAFYYEGV